MRADRLLNVAIALRESKRPGMFTMYTYAHPCGTPACALGHYAARRDMQDVFSLTKNGTLLPYSVTETGCEHFGISNGEYYELFDICGCGNAKTPEEAASYIERFVDRKLKEQSNG